MSYNNANLICLVQAPQAGPRVWMYTSADAATSVRLSGYFSDGATFGMQDGDLIFYYLSSSKIWYASTVLVSAGVVDLTDATTIASGTSSD